MSDEQQYGSMPFDVLPDVEEHAQPADALLAEFVEIDNERKELEDRVAEIKARKEKIQAVLIDEWANSGIQRVTLNGRTVSIHNTFICGKKGEIDKETICDALTASGYGDLVKTQHYEPASLKALIREIESDQDREIPEALEPLIHHYKKPSLRVTAGS